VGGRVGVTLREEMKHIVAVRFIWHYPGAIDIPVDPAVILASKHISHRTFTLNRFLINNIQTISSTSSSALWGATQRSLLYFSILLHSLISMYAVSMTTIKYIVF
jgi:hypothetical protein